MAGITTTQNIDVQVRELDFVSRFAKNWQALRDIMGISRPIRKAPGTQLKSYITTVTLESGTVAEGAEIPYSQASITEAAKTDITVEKYAKGVSIEAVAKYGAEIAVEKTDEEFLNALQANVLSKFYTFLGTGSLIGAAANFQEALAKAKGAVLEKFASIDRTVTDVVGFVNIADVYTYLGTANITVQSQFGLNYIKDFMGYSTLFLLPNKYIAAGKVIAVPVENIDLYYVDPSDSDFAKLGLEYTTDGETNLIGFHVEGDYKHAVGDMFALLGMTLWAEYLDGIAVIDIDDDTLSDLTVSAESNKTLFDHTVSSMQSGIRVADGKITGTLKYIENFAESGPLAGSGNYLALKWANLDAATTSLKVGLTPSMGSGLVECFDDSDRNGVFKITDKNNQKFTVIQADAAGHRNIQYYDLSGLVLETE